MRNKLADIAAGTCQFAGRLDSPAMVWGISGAIGIPVEKLFTEDVDGAASAAP